MYNTDHSLRKLYPDIAPYRSGMLRVSPVHEIYWEECGNPQGKPGVGQLEHQPGQRDQVELVAQQRRRLPDPQQAEITQAQDGGHPAGLLYSSFIRAHDG